METGKFVEAIDKLNRLKDEGIIDENEYEKQMKKIKKQYSNESNIYNKSNTANYTANAQNNLIASLVLIIIFSICGIWLFSSNIFKDLTSTSKEIVNDFKDYTTLGRNNDNAYSNNINKSNNKDNKEYSVDKKTYNINTKKNVRLFSKGNITLTALNYQTENYNSIVGKVQDGQEWVIVNMKLENTSSTTIVINKNDFKIVDGAGRYGYRPYYKHLNSELDTQEIWSGKTATFSIRFVYYKNNQMSLRYYNSDIEDGSYDSYIEFKLR